MSAILPPSDRLWWKQPIDKVEWAWIAIAFVWGMIMFGMMIYWHIYGKQNLSNEAYKTTPELFAAKAEKFIAENTIRTETDQDIPVVRVPPGGDGYLIARLWAWYPILELEEGQTYKIHLSSMDYNHGFSLQPVNINIQVIPGYEHVVKMTPTKKGTYAIVCNEFCGIGHSWMLGRIYVK
ncbi:MAG: cytochrome c oxidase subunit 2 [Candidatus Accumulibacter regalis]|jgi:cytochrome c oxidase subunit 2|uniref:Cytochrome c oxidase subunit 2 n=1 Tax=Accumulibacter regalis TaxID=522306 RepID=A0A011RG04_ACCRE|nr:MULTISPECIES: cytochrome c oxidase subunit II [unclassified Candidatus Accumulibacter]EXI90149.1 MAG: cytochrome c oxidase subunit 2 [Candidatus Accumulibacter regalis]MQM33794.1 cytochrome C oxidase subunit II [Candidatus Accumulibacter phosphatis]MBL8367476.1 cytochrome C oxidase subunit II [Accumulibacter sp.]MBN8515392.1 cytochrome C oxidase subunit II [Accumulibacter sp.]HRE72091.1 cytochrome C oxidase subunit II [Accumulibacter sp.]